MIFPSTTTMSTFIYLLSRITKYELLIIFCWILNILDIKFMQIASLHTSVIQYYYLDTKYCVSLYRYSVNNMHKYNTWLTLSQSCRSIPFSEQKKFFSCFFNKSFDKKNIFTPKILLIMEHPLIHIPLRLSLGDFFFSNSSHNKYCHNFVFLNAKTFIYEDRPTFHLNICFLDAKTSVSKQWANSFVTAINVTAK